MLKMGILYQTAAFFTFNQNVAFIQDALSLPLPE